MKVSIIIPIYNVESYIIECLESVFSQTYKDIEVIVVDDCGTDNSMLLVQQFVSTHDSSTFIIIHHDKNKGVSAARNTGIKAATGEYLYFLDSDDYLTSDCIESFVSLAMKYNRPDGVFGSATQFPWNLVLFKYFLRLYEHVLTLIVALTDETACIVSCSCLREAMLILSSAHAPASISFILMTES